MKTAYLAGGCFWCITPTFRELPGVRRVISGYSGGSEEAPTYQQVKSQQTGHRETIRIDYEGDLFARLVEIFLAGIDPFDAGGQFIDRGHSYTTAIYYQTPEEKAIAEARLSALAAEAGQTPAVAVEPFRSFWEAEAYHQDYDLKNPEEFEQELISSGRKKA